ncbi:polysaccharide pyruvyl transferase family protein [Lysinibacillus sp. SGAir0095]|uniref:polysaccharide pyruvyl transferase family protein n=1 Tax=Lysinibacillus sp. SGAir0095 TaxID=2070463 RepID=UPI0010CCFFDF|nr:polysaccharide pyruvyl transferase family protein [Lysinibacillus sp. SGAir0095]QCR31889.1 hypothetical protein C1N55_06720 [Lysinibacillus sp. SGAir0095]
MGSIAFTGYYGMQNYGDDLFVVASTFAAKRYWDMYPEVSIIGSPIDNLDVNFSVTHLRKLYAGHNFVSKLYRTAIMVNSFIQNELVVLSGGSTISSDSSNKMRKLQNMLAEKGISKIAAIGVSIGPFTTKKDIDDAKAFINNFSFLSVRDKFSYNLLHDLEIKIPYVYGKDLAGLIPLLYPYKIEKDDKSNKVLGISLCNYESFLGKDESIEKKRNLAIFNAIKKITDTYRESITIKICVLNTHPIKGDMKISSELVEFLGENFSKVKIVYHESDPIKMWNEISECDAFFSVRLHGGISAFLLDIPFALVEYHNKCSDFLDDILQPSDLKISKKEHDSDYIYNIIERILFDKNVMDGLYPSKKYTHDTIKTFTEAPWVNSK